MSTAPAAIVPATRERLLECDEVARRVFGFSDAETIPAWLVHTSTLFGGVARMALAGGEAVGFAFAFPAVDEQGACLFLTEVSVLPEHRSRGIGLRLLTAVRDGALELGHERMVWTTNALSSRTLHLYLVRCGAELVRMRPAMYDGLFDHHAPDVINGDEVELEWRLRDDSVAAALAGPARRAAPHVDTERVEIPYDVDALRIAPAELRRGWREQVRMGMETLLAAGYRGVDLASDQEARRSFVVFVRGWAHDA